MRHGRFIVSRNDTLLTFLVIISWALNITLIRMGALEIPPLFLLSIRFALGFCLFFPFARRLDFDGVRNVSSYAAFYIVLHLGLLYAGLGYVSSSVAGLVLEVGPAFVIILGWLFYKEKFGIKTFAGLLLAFAGVAVILYSPDAKASLMGAVLITISAMCWAVGALRMRGIKSVDLATMTVYSHAFAFPFIACGSYFLETGQAEALSVADPWVIGGILTYQVLLMSWGLHLWKGLMVRNAAYKLAAIGLLQPVFVVIFGFWLLNETLSMTAVLGGVMAFSGVGIITLRKMQKAQKT